MRNNLFLLTSLLCVTAIAGCQATGEEYAANVYKADQVNSRQEAKTVQILAVMPAKIEVSNAKQKKAAQASALQCSIMLATCFS